jgi:hypothetical protein
VTNVEHRFRSWIRPIERLDRNSWGDVHDDAVRFTLTAPVGLDMLARHLYLATVGTGGSLQMVTARRSRGTRYPLICVAGKAGGLARDIAQVWGLWASGTAAATGSSRAANC